MIKVRCWNDLLHTFMHMNNLLHTSMHMLNNFYFKLIWGGKYYYFSLMLQIENHQHAIIYYQIQLLKYINVYINIYINMYI